ncbi:DNA-binding protein c1d [Actinomortierella ambigua]|nr:DNA-binding protein c1d [Actinomortierella ambigua]
MASTLPDSHAGAVNAMLSSLTEVETLLEPLFATSTSLNETLAKLDTEKRCQLELMVAYAINTLAFVNLKTNGVAPNTHPVMKELARIKNYTAKIKAATTVSKPSMSVDTDAADRFIRSALAQNVIADKKEAAAKNEGSNDNSGSDQEEAAAKNAKRSAPSPGNATQRQRTVSSSSSSSATTSTDGPRKKTKSKK